MSGSPWQTSEVQECKDFANLESNEWRHLSNLRKIVYYDASGMM